jgi:hypothetical protein
MRHVRTPDRPGTSAIQRSAAASIASRLEGRCSIQLSYGRILVEVSVEALQ